MQKAESLLLAAGRVLAFRAFLLGSSCFGRELGFLGPILRRVRVADGGVTVGLILGHHR